MEMIGSCWFVRLCALNLKKFFEMKGGKQNLLCRINKKDQNGRYGGIPNHKTPLFWGGIAVVGIVGIAALGAPKKRRAVF